MAKAAALRCRRGRLRMDGDAAMVQADHGTLRGVLDRLMPMHLMLDRAGRVLSHGPTLSRLFRGRNLQGQMFLDLFEVRSPHALTSADEFAAVAGQKLRLTARMDDTGLRLRAILLAAAGLTGGRELTRPEAVRPEAVRPEAGRPGSGEVRLVGAAAPTDLPDAPARPASGKTAVQANPLDAAPQGGAVDAVGVASGPDRGPPVAAWVINLSFGIDLPRAVGLLQLTDADFALTDLAMELLYLVEANEAVTGELRALATRLDRAKQQAREEAETDVLTGLRNRRACDSVLARLCRDGEAFAVLHMDLDYFKTVNDTLGHAAGDHVLVHVASVMKTASRAGDCLARVGGDEFVMLLPGAQDPVHVRHIAERVIAQLTRPIAWNGAECRVSASVGMVLVKAGAARDPVQVMADADAALYAAKNAGRGRVMRSEPRAD